MTRIDLEGGKYSVIHDNGIGLLALRYGEPWRNCCGDGLILALVQEIESLRDELAATRKQLAEAQSSDSVTVRYDLSPLKTEEAIKAKVRELGWLDPDAAESLRRKLAEAQAPHINIAHSYVQEVPDHCDRITWRGRYFHLHGINSVVAIDAALDAAIAEAIADEKRNSWKQAIINELVVSHILHTDHETNPIKALAALVDYECKVALDPVVSKEAQSLIEPYRKDAERVDWLEQQGHAYGFHDMHEGNRWTVEGPFATLRQLADAAIAAAKEQP